MRISVVVPVYNVERYLDRCFNSLLAQTDTDFDIILVDDGSTDRSGQLCDHFAAQHPKVQTIHQENSGLGMARNSGLEKAAGEYVLFLDSDDYFGPDLLKNLSGAAQRTRADLIIGGHAVVGAGGRKNTCAPSREQVFSSPEEMRELLLHTVGTPPKERMDSKYGVSACGRLYRREVIQRGGLRFMSERLLISEDLIFNLEFMHLADSAIAITDASYFYCTNGGSLSNRHREDRFAQDCILCKAAEDRLARWYPEEEYQLSLARLLISRARYDIAQEVDYHDLADRTYPLQEKIRAILCQPELHRALEGYPWWKLPWMQRVFACFMKRKKSWALVALVRLKRRFLPKY